MQKRITRQFVVGAVAALGMIGGAASAADTVAAAELKPTQGSSVGGTVRARSRSPSRLARCASW
jgi:hypothetical protein